MAYEKRDNTGSLFVNDRKQQESHADYQGSIMVGGVEYWLNGWKKQTRNGKSWLSLSVKPKEARSDSHKLADEDIPFGGTQDGDAPW